MFACDYIREGLTGESVESATAVARFSDEELVRAMAAGNERALEGLYQRHGPGLLNYLLFRTGGREVAEELLQDVMLAAWRGSHRFRGEASVRSWLFAIAHNRAVSWCRRPRVVVTRWAATIEDRLASGKRPAQRATEDLGAVWHRLSSHHREVLELAFYHELTERELANVLGVARGTVKSRLHRAKRALQRLIEEDRGEHG